MKEGKPSRPLDLDRFDGIDWDEEEDECGNLQHCMDHGIDECVVDEVLAGSWIDVEMEVYTAEFAIVGPDEREIIMWTLLFDESYKRGDRLRPVTGWIAKPKEIKEWQTTTRQSWRGRWPYG